MRLLVSSLVFIGSVGLACGSSDATSSNQATGAAGSSGAAGSQASGAGGAHAGGAATTAGTGGIVGASGSAGAAGTAAGKGGSVATSGGAAGASGGAAGSAGAVVAGGSGGTSSQGGGGASSGCTDAADCPALTTTPAGCAVATCDAASHACTYASVDGDGDGFATSTCSGPAGSKITVGTDCDDTNPEVHPGAWDGPASGTHDASCDKVDTDCDGTIDDSVAPGGVTCSCAPGQTRQCTTDSSGAPLDFPGGTPIGPCHYGTQLCGGDGTYGLCTGYVEPKPEICNNIDDDCNGTIDDNPTDPVSWSYDGDRDGHAAIDWATVLACNQTPPTTPPKECVACGSDPSIVQCCKDGQTAGVDCCPLNGWVRTGDAPSDDCNDNDPTIHPGASDSCVPSNTVDRDCDGMPHTNCCVPLSQSAACGVHTCGMADNGCGTTYECGTCTLPNTCGGSGQTNVCGCTQVGDPCVAAGAECGNVTNNCGKSVNCGPAESDPVNCTKKVCEKRTCSGNHYTGGSCMTTCN